MTRTRIALVVALAALGLAVAAPLAAARTASTVTVTLKEFKFTFSSSKVAAGTVTFKLVNKGHLAHDLKIAGKKSSLIQPGKSGKLTVTLKKGKYPYLCTVPGHAAAGMKGTLTVT
jgi:uncharacterized cupredoxin-like copper-binding protein